MTVLTVSASSLVETVTTPVIHPDQFNNFDEFVASMINGPDDWSSNNSDDQLYESREWWIAHEEHLASIAAKFGKKILGYGAEGLVTLSRKSGRCIKYISLDNSMEMSYTELASTLGVGPKVYYLKGYPNRGIVKVEMDVVKGIQFSQFLIYAMSSGKYEEWQLVWQMIEEKIAVLEKYNICHNDLHCENVFVELEDGIPVGVKFIDWGWSCPLTQLKEEHRDRDHNSLVYTSVKYASCDI